MILGTKHVDNGTVVQQNVFVDIQQQKCVQMLLAAAAAVRVLHISQRRVTVLYSCSSDWRLTSSRRSMVLTFGKNTGSHDSSVLICKWERMCFDVVLKTRVLVSSHLEDKNENLGVGLGSWSLSLEQLEKRSCSFQDFCCNSWRQWARHTTAFCERQQKQFAILKPLFERTFCAPYTSASVESVFKMGLFVRPHRRQ